MQKKTGLVSFIISAYNEERYIEACIDSCLKQTYRNIEIVLVNDGSTDSTSDLVNRRFGGNQLVHFIDLAENKGKVSGFNTAFENSRGDHIAIMGADDICYPDRIAVSLEHMQDGIGMVCSDLDKIDADGKVIERNIVRRDFGLLDSDDFSTKALIERPKVFGGTILLSREMAKRVFPLDAVLGHEDWHIPIVASLHSGIVFVDKPLIGYRIHESNSSGSNMRLTFSRWIYLKKRRVSYFKELIRLVDEHGIDTDRDRLNYLLAQAEVFSEKNRLRYCLASLQKIRGAKNRAKLALHLLPYSIYIMEQTQKKIKAFNWHD